MTIGEHDAFRVTRNADLALEEDEADDLLVAVEMELRRRRFGSAVRLEIASPGQPRAARDARPPSWTCRPTASTRSTPPIDLSRAVGRLRPRPPRPPRGDVDADDPAPPGHGGQRADGPLRRAARARRARPPPLRLLRHLGGGLRGPGGGRPRRARHQADPLPHLGRQPDRGLAHQRGRGGQAGGGDRRAEGPLRRAGQHRLGPGARGGRRPRRLRPGGPEDPLEDRAGAAARGGRHPPLLPRGHRATTTPRRPASTRTSGCSPRTPTSGPTWGTCSTT